MPTPTFFAVQSVGIGGEIKSVRKTQLYGMLGALVSTAVVIAAFDLLATRVFTYDVQGAIGFNSIIGLFEPESGAWAFSTESTIGASPWFTVLVGVLADNLLLAVIVMATFAAWIWFWVPAEIAYTTRTMIAWSFDRIAPDRLGEVSKRFNTPTVRSGCRLHAPSCSCGSSPPSRVPTSSRSSPGAGPIGFRPHILRPWGGSVKVLGSGGVRDVRTPTPFSGSTGG
jgi:hypothetical protein